MQKIYQAKPLHKNLCQNMSIDLSYSLLPLWHIKTKIQRREKILKKSISLVCLPGSNLPSLL